MSGVNKDTAKYNRVKGAVAKLLRMGSDDITEYELPLPQAPVTGSMLIEDLTKDQRVKAAKDVTKYELEVSRVTLINAVIQLGNVSISQGAQAPQKIKAIEIALEVYNKKAGNDASFNDVKDVKTALSDYSRTLGAVNTVTRGVEKAGNATLNAAAAGLDTFRTNVSKPVYNAAAKNTKRLREQKSVSKAISNEASANLSWGNKGTMENANKLYSNATTFYKDMKKRSGGDDEKGLTGSFFKSAEYIHNSNTMKLAREFASVMWKATAIIVGVPTMLAYTVGRVGVGQAMSRYSLKTQAELAVRGSMTGDKKGNKDFVLANDPNNPDLKIKHQNSGVEATIAYDKASGVSTIVITVTDDRKKINDELVMAEAKLTAAQAELNTAKEGAPGVLWGNHAPDPRTVEEKQKAVDTAQSGVNELKKDLTLFEKSTNKGISDMLTLLQKAAKAAGNSPVEISGANAEAIKFLLPVKTDGNFYELKDGKISGTTEKGTPISIEVHQGLAAALKDRLSPDDLAKVEQINPPEPTGSRRRSSFSG